MELRVCSNSVTNEAKITIDSDGPGSIYALLKDISGKVVKEFRTSGSSDSFKIDRDKLPSGLYNLCLSTSTGEKVVKIYIR